MSRTYSRLDKFGQVFNGTISSAAAQTAVTSAKWSDFKSGYIIPVVSSVAGSGSITAQVQTSNDGGTTWNNIGAAFTANAAGMMYPIDYDVLGGSATTETANIQVRLNVTALSGTSVTLAVLMIAREPHYFPSDGTVVNS